MVFPMRISNNVTEWLKNGLMRSRPDPKYCLLSESCISGSTLRCRYFSDFQFED